ncbi:hypothetical protein KIPB_012848, partial [Kipferlia bialata]|eukprot:g12848.t1
MGLFSCCQPRKEVEYSVTVTPTNTVAGTDTIRAGTSVAFSVHLRRPLPHPNDTLILTLNQ